MAKYGVYEIATDVHHSLGNSEFDFPAGRYEPTTPEEAEACALLCSVSYQAPDAEKSTPFAVRVEDPDPPAAETDKTAPPAAAPEAAGDPAGDGDGQAPDPLAEAKDEVAKAEADIAAAEAKAGGDAGAPPAASA